MSNKTLTRAEISEQIVNKCGLNRLIANKILEDVLEEMCIGIEKDQLLKLSSFGSFSLRSKKQRVGRNPKTGKEVVITPRSTISFHASNILKSRVLKGI